MEHVSSTGEMKYKMLVGKPEWKRQFSRPRHRWQNDSKLNVKEIGLEGVDWIHLA
jgi:hypothetical protein